MTGDLRGEPIRLSDEGGFTATIEIEDWLTVGAPVSVSRPPRQGPWEGAVLAFNRSLRSHAEWHLASGERREAYFYSPPADGYVTGRKFPVSMGRNTWEASVIDHEPMIQVTVRYTIQNGAVRRRDLYCPGLLTVYAKPAGEDRLAVVAVSEEKPRGTRAPGEAGGQGG